MKTLISEDSPYKNWRTLLKLIALLKNLIKQAKATIFWHLEEREDLKMIHDENNVLLDDE